MFDDYQNAEAKGVLEEADHSASIEEKQKEAKVNIILDGVLGSMCIVFIQPVGKVSHSIGMILRSCLLVSGMSSMVIVGLWFHFGLLLV
jgi:hypothetical protein